MILFFRTHAMINGIRTSGPKRRPATGCPSSWWSDLRKQVILFFWCKSMFLPSFHLKGFKVMHICVWISSLRCSPWSCFISHLVLLEMMKVQLRASALEENNTDTSPEGWGGRTREKTERCFGAVRFWLVSRHCLVKHFSSLHSSSSSLLYHKLATHTHTKKSIR